MLQIMTFSVILAKKIYLKGLKTMDLSTVVISGTQEHVLLVEPIIRGLVGLKRGELTQLVSDRMT